MIYTYDAAGNLTKDSNGHTYAYDAENRQVSYDNGLATYSYDGDGRRVKKVTGIVTTIFVYNAMGQLVAEYSTSTPEGSGGTSYLTSDALGTPRVITGANGAVKARHDYLAFGEELQAGVGGRTTNQGYSSDNVSQKFTGKIRDGETGLDYFGARYFSSAQGRFTSTDPIYFQKTMLIDPQRFNLYSYVLNNPLKLVDPSGMIARVSANGNPNEAMNWFRTLAGDLADRLTFDAVKDKDGNILYYNGFWCKL